MKLGNKVAIITGGSVGIGRRTAERFIEEGATVVICSRSEETGIATASEIGCTFIQTDVSDPAQVENLVNQTVEMHGKLDILVNNAAITGDQAHIADTTLENWNQVTSINLNGVFYGMKYALKHMEGRGSGVIINIVSTVGMVGFPHVPAYGAAKAGVINLTMAGAAGYAPKGIRVNAIAPSVVETPMLTGFINNSPDPAARRAEFDAYNPYPGLVTTDSIAGAAVFLASDDGEF
ncbi:MAG: SDR family NAD(P)-dependent oxidoreductase, partial [Chloroflexota bacterium]